MIFLIASIDPAETNIAVPSCTFAELEHATNSELNNLYTWLKGSRSKVSGRNWSETNIQLVGHPICTVEHAKLLGLIIDDRLSWSNHVKELCRKLSSAIGALRRIMFLISHSTAV